MDEGLTVKLPDGRALAYAEYGHREGVPVFYFHGTPGSRLQGRLLDDAASRAVVRLICVDRPGYGGSTFLRRRRFTDWPADVAHLADALGIGRFLVAGMSGGGPHALACARLLPERVAGVLLLSSAVPIGAVLADVPAVLRPGVRAWLWLTRPFMRASVAWAAFFWMPFRRVLRMVRYVDTRVLARAEMRDAFDAEVSEAFRQGGRATSHEFVLHAEPWRFDPRAIAQRVRLWHGTKDRIVRVAHARRLAALLRRCEARYFEGEGHLLFAEHPREVADALLDLARSDGRLPAQLTPRASTTPS